MYEKFGLFIPGPSPLIGARERSGMKPSAIEVNTDQGGIADEAALSEVLLSRRLSGAGLDVFDMEPPLADSPPLRGERRVLNPYSVALTEEAATRRLGAAVTNITDFFSGRLDPQR
ncbi:NAD(P)-dependent oxidoreductase [Caballeronia mineralivorans]|uniref:NAD(P)-dependent oxidoreductase n=1 Tax=Caballeronia mineralivorans TaxID=2010198 RepID=UPI00069EBC31|nr:NAD(P)-dependent oxidoreductase [Caballeronia mineralivorans]